MLTSYNIIIIGITYRFLIFFLLVFFPFNHETFGLLSPLTYQGFADLGFYYNFGEQPFKIFNFFSVYKEILSLNFSNIDNRFPGPLFPLLLMITSYGKTTTTLYLAILVFSCEILSYIIWSSKKFYFSKISLLFFSIMPIPLYFGFFHSTDIIFYFLFTILYFEIVGNKRPAVLTIIYIFIVSLRPNSALVLIACLTYFWLNKDHIYLIILSAFFLILSIFYYSPYFFYEMEILNNSYDKNINNIFELILFHIINYFKKVIFIIGFIPSDSGNIYFYLLRCVCGTIFSIGLLTLLYRRDDKLNLIFVCFFIFGTASIFFPAYRYILPITPILTFYFCNLLFKKFKF